MEDCNTCLLSKEGIGQTHCPFDDKWQGNDCPSWQSKGEPRIRSWVELITAPPSSNKIWRSTFRGKYPHTYLTPEAVVYKEDLVFDLLPTRQAIEKVLGYNTSELAEIVFNFIHFMKDRRSDCSNSSKLLSDGLEDAFSLNDRNFLCRDIDRIVVPKMKQSVILMQIIPIEKKDKLREEKIRLMDLGAFSYMDRILTMMEAE